MTIFTRNPLATCKLRTAGLKSVKGAMFGMTRTNPNGSPRAHQGIDLASDMGYRCYAVENGTVVGIAMGKDGYGFTITLKLDCPEKKELHNLNSKVKNQAATIEELNKKINELTVKNKDNIERLIKRDKEIVGLKTLTKNLAAESVENFEKQEEGIYQIVIDEVLSVVEISANGVEYLLNSLSLKA